VYLLQADSFSDGWNGAYFVVYDVVGSVVLSATLESGSYGTDALCLAWGCYTYEVTAGVFPSEISWELAGTNDGFIAGEANATGSFSVGLLNGGCTDPLANNYYAGANCNDGTCAYSCPGDFDNNGVVNVADLLLLISAFGCTSSCNSLFDVAPNGVINTSDLLVFVSAFGTTCP
jgi:hypothetical protein